MFKSIPVLLLFILLLTGCAKFDAGDCIQNVNDAFIWRIIDVINVPIRQYKMQGLYDGKWGLPVNGDVQIFDGDRYVKVTCPFSTQALHKAR